MKNKGQDYGSFRPTVGESNAALGGFCSSASVDMHNSYEELGVTIACPTCDGTGRIPKDHRELVAIIPLSDKRLKPARTVCWVLLAISICAIGTFLAIFFLLPRDITLEPLSKGLDPWLSRTIDNVTTRKVYMETQDCFLLKNENYYDASVANFTLIVNYPYPYKNYRTQQVGVTKNTTEATIPLRGSLRYCIDINITISGDQYTAARCGSNIRQFASVTLSFGANAYVSSLGHTNEVALSQYQHVNCFGVSPATTIIPASTKTTPSPGPGPLIVPFA